MTHNVPASDEGKRIAAHVEYRQHGRKRDPHMAADENPARPACIDDETEAILIGIIRDHLKKHPN